MHRLKSQAQISCFLKSNAGLPSSPAGREVWDYVEVRDGAHMFWWLYYADSQTAHYQDLPLVMWLQVGRSTATKQITVFHCSSVTNALAVAHCHLNKKQQQNWRDFKEASGGVV